MTAPPEPAETRERLDVLRRRLYRDGATAEDLRRYAEEREALAPAEPEPVDRQGQMRRRRPLVAVGIGAALLVAVIGIAVTAPAAPARLPPRSIDAAPTIATDGAPAAGTAVVVQDIGNGQTLEQRPGAVQEETAVLLPADDGVAVAQRFQGSGDAVVRLDTSAASVRSGRVVVAVSSAGTGPIAWRALRAETYSGWSAHPSIVATGTSAAEAPDVFGYVGSPPWSIAVQAPDGGSWALVVGFVEPTR
ncbi:hypothetical protein [uncultured Amnibacterium sp.]|uniref:hypothetical protein n=1 Tax=uncultured Amnibacterium sp. TaxID=1631851 RepID=UPI0035C9CD34